MVGEIELLHTVTLPCDPGEGRGSTTIEFVCVMMQFVWSMVIPYFFFREETEGEKRA
jgi:hypothetical protein